MARFITALVNWFNGPDLLTPVERETLNRIKARDADAMARIRANDASLLSKWPAQTRK